MLSDDLKRLLFKADLKQKMCPNQSRPMCVDQIKKLKVAPPARSSKPMPVPAVVTMPTVTQQLVVMQDAGAHPS